MKFKVNLDTYEVKEVQGEWGKLEGIKYSTQHHYLPGHALVEVRLPSMEFRLWHPDTDHSTGHVDIFYMPERPENELGVIIRPYQLGLEIESFCGDRLHAWPSGGWNLFRVIDAVEQFMAERLGYEPRLRHWIEMNFLTVPWYKRAEEIRQAREARKVANS